MSPLLKLGLSIIASAGLIGQTAFAEKPEAPRAPTTAPKKPTSTKSPDAAAIANLIAQLSAPRFIDRRDATRALEGIGPPALTPLRKAAADTKDVELRQRAMRLVGILENRLDQLVIDYRSHDLPMPPPSARLVRFTEDGTDEDEPQPTPPSFCLAFLLKPGNGKTGPMLQLGAMEYRSILKARVKVVDVERAAAKDLLAYVRESRLDRGTGMLMAIQCQARGWDVLAQSLLAASLAEDVNLDPKFCPDDAAGSFYWEKKLRSFNFERVPKTILIREAWDYWESMLIDPGTSWPLTARRLKGFLAQEPRLELRYRRYLVKSLELALVPSKARAGSVQALIDDLINVRSTNIPYGRGDESDPRYLKLVNLGFAVVPDLIENLDDKRLTRAIKQGFNNFPSYHFRVGDVVSDLLQELAGEDVGKNWLRRQQGYGVEKADARAWWQKARTVGEKAYLVGRVLPRDPKAKWPIASCAANESFLVSGSLTLYE